ncbi:MAG TPA: hypothetical protein VHC94_03140 [Nitrobacter sp.]|nr:hypothetical protein [Nitrobacter sp.]
MTRAMTVLALACCLVVGVVAVSMSGRDVAGAPETKSSSPQADNPAANRAAKADRLPVAIAAETAGQTGSDQLSPAEPLREAFATDSPLNAPASDTVAPIAMPPLPSPRPKAADLPPPQKSYSLLSDMQIAALKERLQLTPAQAPYWPPVETALRDVARKIHARRMAGGPSGFAPEDIDQVKAAANPLLAKLREDQKREARSLARIIGLDAIASLI